MIKHFSHAIMIAGVTTCLIGLTAISVVPTPERQQLSQADVNHIERQLLKKCADDCVLEQTKSGWKCKEIKTGKVFKIARKI
ncbi:MAG: hypothetical protein ABFD75_12070 [Smithella sp.]